MARVLVRVGARMRVMRNPGAWPMRLRSTASFSVLAVLLGCAQTMDAQTNAPVPRARVPVTVALVDSLPMDDPGYRILRRAGGTPRDVILLRSAADGAIFSEAVRSLAVIRAVTGDTADASAFVRAHPSAGEPARTRVLPWAERVLNDLRSANPRVVPGVGRVRAVEFWLPAQSSRPRPPYTPLP